MSFLRIRKERDDEEKPILGVRNRTTSTDSKIEVKKTNFFFNDLPPVSDLSLTESDVKL